MGKGKKRRHVEWCQLCGQHIVGFSEKHVQRNLYIHKRTSGKHELLRGFIKHFDKDEEGELEYEGVIIARIPHVLYNLNKFSAGTLDPGQSFDDLPQHKGIEGVFVCMKFDRDALRKLEREHGQDLQGVLRMLSEGHDLLRLKSGKEINVQVDISPELELSKGDPEFIHFDWNDMRAKP